MIPLIENNVVSRGWLTSQELTDFMAISEVTPGPFAINIATFIGSSKAGIFGSICATLGVVLPSVIIILLVAAILTKVLKNKYVQAGLNGIRPVALSLIISTTILMFVKVMFFSSQTLKSEFRFDITSFSLFLILLGIYFVNKKVNKKALHPILLIVLGAIFGLIIFI